MNKEKITKKGSKAIDEVEKATSDLLGKLKEAKKKYSDMDEEKKKKALKAIAGVGALLGAMIGAKKIKDKYKDEK